jgi:hypothetical protein
VEIFYEIILYKWNGIIHKKYELSIVLCKIQLVKIDGMLYLIYITFLYIWWLWISYVVKWMKNIGDMDSSHTSIVNVSGDDMDI